MHFTYCILLYLRYSKRAKKERKSIFRNIFIQRVNESILLKIIFSNLLNSRGCAISPGTQRYNKIVGRWSELL